MGSFLKSGRELSTVVASHIVDYLYPLDCAICGQLPFTYEQQTLLPNSLYSIAARELCPDCNDFSKALIARSQGNRAMRCSLCGERAIKLDLCLLCQVAPPSSNLLWSALPYEGTLKELLRIYKYSGRRTLGSVLARILAATFAEEMSILAAAGSLVIVPVPSCHESLRKRGFHHLLPLCRELSVRFGYPLKLFALESAQERAPQVTLDPDKRLLNMAGAFKARKRFVQGKSVLLVDDVLTTGATLDAASETLLNAGANSVHAITLARSSQFMHHRLERLSRTWPKTDDTRKKKTKDILSHRRDGGERT